MNEIRGRQAGQHRWYNRAGGIVIDIIIIGGLVSIAIMMITYLINSK